MEAAQRNEQQQLQLQNYEKYTLTADQLKGVFADVVCLTSDLSKQLKRLHGAVSYGRLSLPNTLKYCCSRMEGDIIDLEEEIRQVMGKTHRDYWPKPEDRLPAQVE